MTTATAQRMAESFAASQKSLADRTSQRVITLWGAKMVAGVDLRTSADEWIAEALKLIATGRKLSAQRARGYYLLQRRAEMPDAPTFRMPANVEPDLKAMTTSLWVTGPQSYVDRGLALDDVMSEERVNAISGAVARHTMNGGRQLIEAAYQADPLAVGYYRTEDADPCYFCAALMSRGTVFKEDSFENSDARYFGPGDAKVHDHCGGGLVPSYDASDPFPGPTAEYGALWKQFKFENDGPDDLEAWRKWLQAREA